MTAVHADLDATGLRPPFTDVHSGEDAPRSKWVPGLSLLTAALLAVAPAPGADLAVLDA
ncbi:hypothetical protein [Streptomyces sp. NBC_00690]|uniref:hypothetical protein n=1 Tax=Streptomyces sp. NBC_00690 TaxID=2975808 RepID=UPI002E297A01|nr:hypothetical protein [Streptomyces sp. NBC_00690]